ncbi:DUF2589 domain-containing protein [Moorena producens JHB]|uniref:DUF2589 domain-containing protein n=1 Tax=Moorena producens (strain JHB) TaxID=1454205 RepID=A0A1D9G2F8_MOOP1|nr:DUF2589 domain-containing protein [Moorena producens]AOY81809.1 DUF2589 domain-containing protein [Moorena producens JHB]
MSEIEFRGIPIDHLISGPVVAIVKANDMMAKQQVKLLMQSCFSATGDVYEPVMITMSLRRSVLEHGNLEHGNDDSTWIRHVNTNFQVPLITLLPLNSLAIEEADISFSMNAYGHQEAPEEKEDDSTLFSDVPLSSIQPYALSGNISYGFRGETERLGVSGLQESSISVSVSTSKLPLPLGVHTILQAYSQSLHPVSASQEQAND